MNGVSRKDPSPPDRRRFAGAHAGETRYLLEEIYGRRIYDPKLRLPAMQFPDEPTVFDVGANIGVFTVFAATELNAKAVFAFEAIPELRRICSMNVVGLRAVTVLDYAAGAVPGQADFTFYADHTVKSGRHCDATIDGAAVRSDLLDRSRRLGPAGQQFLQGSVDDLVAHRLARTESRQVEISTIDATIERFQLDRVDLVKIDVEGDELAVLEGSTRHRDRIAAFMVEVDAVRATASPVVEWLADSGFNMLSREAVPGDFEMIYAYRA